MKFQSQTGSIRSFRGVEPLTCLGTFQSQTGSIRRYNVDDIETIRQVGFNPKLVRLEARQLGDIPMSEVRFNPKLVRLEDKPQLRHWGVSEGVSIPNWFD